MLNDIVSLDIKSLIYEINKDGNDWILNGLRRGSTGFLIAPPDSGKGYICLSIAYELATNIELIGLKYKNNSKLKTLYWPVEDGCNNVASRILKHFDDMNEKSRLDCEANISLYSKGDAIACSSRVFGNETYTEINNSKCRLIKAAQKYDLLIIDTVREAVGSADEVLDDSVIKETLKEIAIKANVAILCVHHPTKAVARGTEAINSVSSSGLSHTTATSRVNLYIGDTKIKGVKYLKHIKSNFVNKEALIKEEHILWSENSMAYLKKASFKELTNKYIQTPLSVKHTNIKKTYKIEEKEPLVLEPDESLISQNSIDMALAKEKENQIIDKEMLVNLKKFRDRNKNI